MELTTKDEILQLFEKHRKLRGAPYEEDHFLDYLMKSPREKGAVRSSFSGLRRFNAFIDELQLKYSICFSIKDRETSWSLDNFVKRIDELRLSKRSSLTSLRNQMKEGVEWNLIITVNFILLASIILFKNYTILFAFFILLFAAINIFIIWFNKKEAHYQAKLLNQIQGVE